MPLFSGSRFGHETHPSAMLFPSDSGRPLWAQNEESLLRHAVGEHGVRRVIIARMYWWENLSAGKIATKLSMKRNAVRWAIHRLMVKK